MLRKFDTTDDGAALDADLCIVGAGPAGLTIAHALTGCGLSTVVLESGLVEFDVLRQALNQGEVEGGSYRDLVGTRNRQVGGTVNAWNTLIDDEIGAKYAPLDAIDLEARPGQPWSGWPLEAAALEPYYLRAHDLCGLGPYAYDGKHWASDDRPPLAMDPDTLATRVYQFGLSVVFNRSLVDAIAAADDVLLLHDCTVTELRAGPDTRRVGEAKVATLGGAGAHVRAKAFVLAGGAIENARLLLASDGRHPGGMGNGADWVGRCFMEHPRDYTMRWAWAGKRAIGNMGFYDLHRGGDGTWIMGRLAVAEARLRAEGLTQASVTLLPYASAQPATSERWRDRIRRFIKGGKSFPVGYPRGRPGWSRESRAAFEPEGFRLLVNLEQAPDPANRITLSSARDRLACPRVRLAWRWSDEDHARLVRLRAIVANALNETGLGAVILDHDRPPDPHAHHHAGTTRMHNDPAQGVVDADSRVHDMENLYVAGASVFPTAGFANPTLTIVALALRLAECLRSRLS